MRCASLGAPPRPPPRPPRPARRGCGGTAGGASGAVGLMRSSRMKVVISGCVSTIAPLSLDAHLVERVVRQAGDQDRRADDVAVRRRRPRVRIADHRREARLGHLERELLSSHPRPNGHVSKCTSASPHADEVIARPRRGAHVRRRRGEPRADHRRERVDHRPRVRAVQAFVADLGDHGAVERFLRAERRGGDEGDGGEEAARHGSGRDRGGRQASMTLSVHPVMSVHPSSRNHPCATPTSSPSAAPSRARRRSTARPFARAESSFAVFSSPPVARRTAAHLHQRRHALRPLDALAGALAARRAPPGHSVRSARPRRVDRRRRSRSTHRSTTTPPTSAPSAARSAFGSGTCSAIRGAAASRCSRPPPIAAAFVASCSSIRCGPRAPGWRRCAPRCSRGCTATTATPSITFLKKCSATRIPCCTAHTVARCIRRGSPTPRWQVVLHRPPRESETGAAVLARLRREGYDWRERVRALSTPTLVIHGEQDPLPLANSAHESYIRQRTGRAGSRRRPHALLGSATALLRTARLVPVVPAVLARPSDFRTASPLPAQPRATTTRVMMRAAFGILSLSLGVIRHRRGRKPATALAAASRSAARHTSVVRRARSLERWR